MLNASSPTSDDALRQEPLAPSGSSSSSFPEEPVEGYLGAVDSEKEGEEAVTEVVEPGCIDYEG